MAWFFASSTTFLNGNSETVTNSPINLDLANTPTPTTHTPEATSEVLFAIAFTITSPSTTLYLHYPNETARDDDFDLLEAQLALPAATKAGPHTASGFTNTSGEAITNKKINLDFLSTYYKTKAKPEFTSDILFAIAFVSTNKNSPLYLYYANEAARDADYIVIETNVSAISNYSQRLVYTPIIEAVAGTTANAWVKRTLAVGANKTVQIKVVRTWVLTNPLPCGVRQVGSSDVAIDQSVGVFFKTLQTDENAQIEIYANSLLVVFTAVDLITIL